MKLSHAILLDILKKLQYPIGDGDGICQGYALLLSQFICNKNKLSFFLLLDRINQYESVDALYQDIDHTTPLLKNFFEELEHYQYPESHSVLFNDTHPLDDLYKVTRLLAIKNSPERIEQIDLNIVHKKAYILDKSDLHAYLRELQTAVLKLQEIPVVFMLNSDIHSILIQFDSESCKWFNYDIELMDEENYQNNQYNVDELTDSIFRSLESYDDASEEQITGFVINAIIPDIYTFEVEDILSVVGTEISVMKNQYWRVNSRQVELYQIALLGFCIDDFERLFKYGGCNPNQWVSTCLTPLHIACLKNSPKAVETLLSHPDINPNEGDSKGFPPVFYVCKDSRVDILELLIRHEKYDINAWHASNETILHTACALNERVIAERLLAHPGIDSQMVDANGQTALHLSCGLGHVEIIRLLLDHRDIELDMPDNNGLLAIDIIHENYQSEVTDLFNDKEEELSSKLRL
ncbi:MAG: ankyrin repeat domain-containing protein [Legionellaceae bacterium]|nr:ankyrin repeat domain-containing protein [Legionellaceae bacterium]